MAKTVFILGAGASRHAGAPLMNEFLERAWDILASGGLEGEAGRGFGLAWQGASKLQVAHSKGDLDIWNLEAVFDAFEMASLCGGLGDMPTDDVRRLPEAMRQVILVTLQRETQFPLEHGERRRTIVPPHGYRHFVDALTSTWQTTGEWPAVITFNYDVCLDYALAYAERPVDYGLPSTEDGSAVKLLKLHGSLSWAQCANCRKVSPVAQADLIQMAARSALGLARHDSRTCPLVVDPLPGAKCGCKMPTPSVMVVPPTINKGRHHEALSDVWSAAARELRTAQEIFVCGYSLPESDLFFRYLYAVGTIGDASLRRVWVLDPEKGDRVKRRFQALLGKQVLSQPSRFLVLPYRFEEVPWSDVLGAKVGNLVTPM